MLSTKNRRTIAYYRSLLPPYVQPKLVQHKDSRLARFLLWVYAHVGVGVSPTTWFTIGDTVYYPNCVPNYDSLPDEKQELWLAKYTEIFGHEIIHILQFVRLKRVLMFRALAITAFFVWYFVLPLPVFFSGRYFFEREAYLVQLNDFGSVSPGALANHLHRRYLRPWPQLSMYRWFEAHHR